MRRSRVRLPETAPPAASGTREAQPKGVQGSRDVLLRQPVMCPTSRRLWRGAPVRPTNAEVVQVANASTRTARGCPGRRGRPAQSAQLVRMYRLARRLLWRTTPDVAAAAR